MKLNTYYHQDYSGGLNDTAHQTEIARNEASLLQNWDITYAGQLYRRDGLTQSGDTLSNTIDGGIAYLRSSGGKDIVVLEGGTLRYLNGSAFDALDSGFTSGTVSAMEYVPLVDKLYVANEDDTMHSWDRASVVLNSCLTDLGAAVPSGNALRWHKNHLFVANKVHVSGSTYYHRVYWSAMGDPDTYDTTNDFINIPSHGNVVALGDLGDALVIFKEYSIHYMTGWGDTDWRITASASNVANLSEAVGIAGVGAHTRVGNEIWFMDDEGNIRRLYQTDFDAFRSDIISNKIQGTIDSINKAKLHLVQMHTWGDKVYCAVATGSSITNDTVLVYDIKASKRAGGEAWTTYTGWEPTKFFDYPTNTTPDMYVADSNGKVGNHTGDDDYGVAIAARWDGKEDDFDRPERYKRYRFGYIKAPSNVTATVAVHASVDDAAFGDLGDLEIAPEGGTLAPSGNFELFPTGTTAILGGGGSDELKYYFSTGGGAVAGKTLMMSIRHSSATEQPRVNGHTVHYKERQLR